MYSWKSSGLEIIMHTLEDLPERYLIINYYETDEHIWLTSNNEFCSSPI